jgi:hypothetical protein
MSRCSWLCLLALSCADQGQDKDDKLDSLANDTVAQVTYDAAPAPEAPAASKPAPTTGTHLDTSTSTYQPRSFQPTSITKRETAKTIELILRSTPPGATASIDGKPIGITPTYWRGVADGKSHEYTFTLDGYAMARYRFVSTQSGVIHGTLTSLLPVVEGQSQALPASSD